MELRSHAGAQPVKRFKR